MTNAKYIAKELKAQARQAIRNDSDYKRSTELKYIASRLNSGTADARFSGLTMHEISGYLQHPEDILLALIEVKNDWTFNNQIRLEQVTGK